MSSNILMPSGGQTTDEMVILKWYKNVGELVKRGDILFEIETDKAILTVESYAAGTLLEIRYPAGVMVKTGEVVARIGNPNEKAVAVQAKESNALPASAEKLPVAKAPAIAEAPPVNLKSRRDDDRILASPLAKSLARIENVRLEDVADFAAKKLIRKDDVNNFINGRAVSKSLPTEEDAYFIETTSMRRTIARRMKESISISPHYVISVAVDMTRTIMLRSKLNKNLANGIKISYNDILMKVAAKAIQSYPLINSTYEADRIKIHRNVNFGLAIATETGIVVPVARAVNKKSISEIASDNSRNIGKVKSAKFQESDISGGTVTLSNLGMFGVDYFTAIINQPESCILAVGGINKRVVVLENEMVIRDMMNITGSFDHRVVDGAVGAAFLKEVKTILEDPELLLF